MIFFLDSCKESHKQDQIRFPSKFLTSWDLSIVIYCRLIGVLRRYPNTEDFVYLRRSNRIETEYNPYALEVVPFAKTDQNDFCTLSARGITRYCGKGNTEFTSLDQWEREVQLFTALKQVKLFKLYKNWKQFRWSCSLPSTAIPKHTAVKMS